VPARASDAYVTSTFDAFAESFDAKLGKLQYRAPQLVADALARCAGEHCGHLVALDAGCGTGLCGPLIAPWVAHLTGVDLSAGMIERARGRGVYDELERAELTAYLERHPASFDLIVSADTLVYFGPLEQVLAAAAGALRPGGLLIFTAEEAAGGLPDKPPRPLQPPPRLCRPCARALGSERRGNRVRGPAHGGRQPGQRPGGLRAQAGRNMTGANARRADGIVRSRGEW
jgi:SAM-dependent methyltransferase